MVCMHLSDNGKIGGHESILGGELVDDVGMVSNLYNTSLQRKGEGAYVCIKPANIFSCINMVSHTEVPNLNPPESNLGPNRNQI